MDTRKWKQWIEMMKRKIKETGGLHWNGVLKDCGVLSHVEGPPHDEQGVAMEGHQLLLKEKECLFVLDQLLLKQGTLYQIMVENVTLKSMLGFRIFYGMYQGLNEKLPVATDDATTTTTYDRTTHQFMVLSDDPQKQNKVEFLNNSSIYNIRELSNENAIKLIRERNHMRNRSYGGKSRYKKKARSLVRKMTTFKRRRRSSRRTKRNR